MNRLHGVHSIAPEILATGGLAVATHGEGFVEVTRDAALFLDQVQAGDGVLLLFIRHTSASLLIQENADPDVRADLTTAFRRLAPPDAGWIHDLEGGDDMPAHIRTMLTGVSLHVPVIAGKPALGSWQGIYLAEHRERPHHREILLQYIGSRRQP